MKKLEQYELIVIVREGQGKSNKIYITDISKQLEDTYTYEKDNPEPIENTLKGQNVTSRKDNKSSLEVTKSPHNDTDINNTDISNTIFLSQEDKKEKEGKREKESNKKPNEFNLILKNCNHNDFEPQYVNSILQAIRLLYYSSKPLKINNMSIPPSQVRGDLKLLRWQHIDLALRDFRIQSKNQEIIYPVGYLSRCIYNSIFQGELRIETELLYNDLI